MHPSFEKLSDHAYELDENPAEIDAHLRECAPCAQTAWRLQRERRILVDALPEPARRHVSWAWAAAAALLLSVSAIAVHYARRAASLQPRPSAPVARPERPFSEVLGELCRNEVDESVSEMISHAGVPEEARADLREALQFAAVAPGEIFDRYLRGEIDEEMLARTDLLASVDQELRRKLSGENYEKVSEFLEKARSRAAAALALRVSGDLERDAKLTPDQRRRVERILADRVSWRFDVALLPEPIRQIIGLAAISSGEGHQEIVAVLDATQRDLFHGYLKRQRDELRKRYS